MLDDSFHLIKWPAIWNEELERQDPPFN